MVEEVTIVIPVYNEEKSINATLKQVSESMPSAQILVVNDSSTDSTPNILIMLQKMYKNLKVINHATNKGYGGALKTGFKNAGTRYIAFLDADMTYHPKYVGVMLSKVKNERLDCAWCNRFGGKSEMPLIRKIGNKMLVLLFFVSTLKYVPDISSGERLFRKEALEKINYNTLPHGLDMITAMSKRIIKRDLRYGLVRCDYLQRDGSSKLNIITDFLRMSRNILTEK